MSRPGHRRDDNSRLPLATALLAALVVAPAQADRPLTSETADVVERGQCVLDSAARRLRESGAPRVESIGGVLGCGLFEGTQMLLGVQHARSAGSSAQAVTLGGKSNLVEVKAGQTGFGLAYLLGSVKAPGANYRLDSVSVVGLASRELRAGLLGHANLGVSRSRIDSRTSALWSLGVETTADLSFAADLYGESGSRPSVSVGTGYTFRPGWSVNFVLAKSLEAPRGHEASVGLRIAY